MQYPSKLISIPNPSYIQPFHSNTQNHQLPWFCYLCGVSAAQNSQRPKLENKQKINISKTIKTSQQSNYRKSLNFETKIQQKVQKNNVKKKPPKHISGLISTMSSFQGVEGKRQQRLYVKKNVQNNHTVKSGKFINGKINVSYNTNTVIRNQITNVSQIQNVVYGSSQPFIHQSKNINQNGYHVGNAAIGPQKIDNQKIRTSMTISYQNPVLGQQVQRKGRGDMVGKKQNNLPQKLTLNLCRSDEILGYREQKLEESDRMDKVLQNSPSKISTTQEIPHPFTQFRQVVSTNDENQLNKHLKKEKSSNSSKGQKILLSMRNMSSKSESGQTFKSIESEGSHSSYIQFGNKIMIGIRKVESINSKVTDSDQYSEVLSHGQKSFLMPQINQVEEMSRVSSASGFRNWEDDKV